MPTIYRSVLCSTGAWSSRISRAVTILVLLLVTGCLSRPPLQQERFVLSPAQPEPAAGPALDEILGLRNVTVLPQFEGRSLVYRLSESVYETDPYAEFLLSPDRMIGAAVRQWIRAAGVFHDVAEPNSYLNPSRMAELQVTELYGDFRPNTPPASVFAMRFVLMDRSEGNVGKAVLTKTYARRVPVKERTASGVVAAWQQAMTDALNELGSDLAKLKP